VPGRHGVLNSLAAVAAGLELNIPLAAITSALAEFQNADRRFQIKGEARGVLVVDDYGHHPTEILTTLNAARHPCDRRIVAVFQPHRFSRTQALTEDFARAFNDADLLLVLPIYAAGEQPIPGIDSEYLVQQIKRFGHRDVHFAADFAAAQTFLHKRLQSGDLLITLGAGDVWKIGKQWMDNES